VKVFCIFGFLAASISGALAEQPYNPASPAIGWNGAYVGAYAGRAWADVDFSTNAGDLTLTSYLWSQVNIDSVRQVTTGPGSGDANLGGVVVGFNAQQGKWVFGLEADVGAFNLKIGRSGGAPYPDPTSVPYAHVSSATIETDRLITARARVGWTPRSDLLIYATAGLAVTTVRITNSFSDDAPEDGVGGASTSDNRAGLAFGGGAEWALSRNWSLKAEYLFMDFGSVTTRSSISCGPGGAAVCAFFNVTPNQFDTTADLTAQVARIGLNYRF
jgi:outer membrane immunogenic protein